MITSLAPIHPEDFLVFVELDEFSQDWTDLGLNLDDDMWALCATIMVSPEGAPVVAGTGGLRKLRFAPPTWTSGKRGALRVCYAYFPKHAIVLLVMAYGKHEKETLSAAEKKGIKQYLEQTEKWLDSRRLRDK